MTALANAPDGTNINVGCGATDLGLLQAAVRAGDYDLGVAFDGDGDRMLAVDERGEVVDGDQIVAICALALDVALVAVTSMTNLGFHRLMEERGIRVVTTDVGDRYVARGAAPRGRAARRRAVGPPDHPRRARHRRRPRGRAALCRSLGGGSLAEAAAVMPRYAQAKENVPVDPPVVPDDGRGGGGAAQRGARRPGRVLVRPSGTEPLVRVLAEAERARGGRRALC